MRTRIFLVIALVATIGFSSCQKELSDVQKLAALRNVSMSFDSLGLKLNLPDGALSGQSFSELLEGDYDKYSNLANYGLDFVTYMKADNRKESAKDAAFHGMILNTIFGEFDDSPLQIISPAFDVGKDEIKEVVATGNINLLTHKYVGKYIFERFAGSEDLSAKLSPILNYKIGDTEGGINLPQIQRNIRTSASENAKNFLTGLLESDILND